MPSIFTYQDYRKFLADFYEEKKKSSPGFSYQNFSRKAGFSSKSFLFNVIKGKKTLSRASVVRICALMGLSKTEAAYFENLVYFNQSENFTERNFYFEKINAIRPATPAASSARNLRQDQYEFYAKWYHVVIRSLVDLYPEIRQPQALAGMVAPPITARQAQKSLELLLRLGLIVEQADGSFAISSRILSTGPDLESLAVQQFHLNCLDLAAKALRSLPKSKRNFSGLTLGISEDAYGKICGELDAFQEKILAIAENDRQSDSVYQLNFQLFPVAKVARRRKSALATGRKG